MESNEDEFKDISEQIEQLNRRIAAIQDSLANDMSRQERLEQIQKVIEQREQNSDQYDDSIVRQMIECIKVVDTVLSHTCPYKYIPREAFLPMINQDSVDDSTEKWLDNIESRLYYERWYCGHWHISKRVDKLHFLFHDFEIAEE